MNRLYYCDACGWNEYEHRLEEPPDDPDELICGHCLSDTDWKQVYVVSQQNRDSIADHVRQAKRKLYDGRPVAAYVELEDAVDLIRNIEIDD